MSNFSLMYPRCAALGLIVIHDGPGYDELDVEKKLGPTRFANLMAKIERVFCCNHAKYPGGAGFFQPTKDANGNPLPSPTHRVTGYEVHCIYAEDLEAFLAMETARAIREEGK